MFFGMSKLPFLTLAVSMGSVYVLLKLLQNRLQLSFSKSVVYSLFLLVNPLFMYSSFGFMTENYFLFFFLLVLYFYLGNTKKDFLFGIVLTFLAYMVRQLALVMPLAHCIYLLFVKNYRKAFFQFCIFGALVLFHFFVMPKTPEMFENNLKFSRLTYFRYSFSFIYIIGIYMASLLLPLFVIYILNYIRGRFVKRALTSIFVIAVLFVFCSLYFKPSVVWHDKFFYLINVLQRNGFYTENIHGFKPRFADYNNFYLVWDVVAKIAVVSVAYIIFRKKEFIDFNLIIIVLYSGLLLISPKIHDRYLLPLVPLMIIYFARKDFTLQCEDGGSFFPKQKKGDSRLQTGVLRFAEKIQISKLSRVAMLVFLVSLGFFSYNFTLDYVLTNEYVWNKSKLLVAQNKAEAGEIVSTALWNFTHPSIRKFYTYKFTYDPPTKPEYVTNNELVEEKTINYPFNLWRNNKIYLYRRIVEIDRN